MPLKIKRYEPLDHVQEYEATMRVDYTPKPIHYSPLDQWRNRFKARGLIPEVLFDYKEYQYLNNFTTTNDLKYNFFPKCIPHRRKQPQDLLVNFGNLTNYGLKEQKRYDWSLDRQDPRSTLESEYRNVFIEHKIEAKPKEPCKPPAETCDIITWKCKNVPSGKNYRCIPEKLPQVEYRLKYV